jgi:hypothetical protein
MVSVSGDFTVLKLPKYHDRKMPLFIVGYALAFANIGLIGAHLYQNGIQFPQSSIASFFPESSDASDVVGKDSGQTNGESDSGLKVGSANGSDKPLPIGVSSPRTSADSMTPPSTPLTSSVTEPGRGASDPDQAPIQPTDSVAPETSPALPAVTLNESPVDVPDQLNIAKDTENIIVGPAPNTADGN